MIQFACESLPECAAEIGPLWQRHYDEKVDDRSLTPFDPDWERYALLDQIGKLLILTARDEAGALVGYLMAFVDTHLHFKGTTFATVDVFWLAPEHRGGRTALRMLKASEELFRFAGAQIVVQHEWHAKGQGRLLSHLGYEGLERSMKKVL